ncbi:MAG: hypothetical protein LBH03_05140 [Holophagales bacterium]|nr:hypothetical protein [Holophagales bacterium]
MSKPNGTALKIQIKTPIGPEILKVKQEATKVVQGPMLAFLFELLEGYTMEDEGKKAGNT